MTRKSWVLLAGVVLAGCSMGQNVPVAEAEIAKFHAMLDGGQFEQSYANAAPELRNAATQQKWVALLNAVHTKLGKFRSAKTVGWNENYNTSGHYVQLNEQIEYERGGAEEQFLYRIEAGKALLAGYHVNSDALITG